MNQTIARVEALCLTVKDLPGEHVDEVQVDWEGFVGDKHYGLTRKLGRHHQPYARGTEVRNMRQVSLVSREELDEIAARLDLSHIDPAWLGANLTLSGLPNLTHLAPGSQLHFEGGVGLVVDGYNAPCTTAGGYLQTLFPDREKLTNRFPKAAVDLRGLVAWVRVPGVLRLGESFSVEAPRSVPVSQA